MIELKSTEAHAAVPAKQVLKPSRMLQQPFGLLMNIGAPTFKQGIRRLANNYFPEQN